MAATHSLLDIDIDDQKSAEAQLQFQEFATNTVAAELPVRTPTQSREYDLSPSTPPTEPDDKTTSGTSAFWTFEYFQQFFDVDTDQVKERIIWSMIPKPGLSFLQHRIRPKPDLYGPFWICVTLVFSIAISGNVANYIQTAATRNYPWQYDFHLVSLSATAIFAYAWLAPAVLWGLGRWGASEGDSPLSYLELLCVYGYSLAIYVPVSILWVIQVSWLQWALVLCGASLSGAVLLTSTWGSTAAPRRLLAAALTAGLHLLLAAGFMLLLFHVPPIAPTEAPPVSTAKHA